MRVADRARGLRDQRERTAGGEPIPMTPAAARLGDQPQRIEPGARSSTAVNVWPCATPNSLIRAIRGCSRLPYARAAADSVAAIAAVAVSSAWNRLTANCRSKPATPNTLARDTVPLGPIPIGSSSW